jgi:RNA polymerase-binding transcription factor DksA
MFNVEEMEVRLRKLAVQHSESPLADAMRVALDKLHVGRYGFCEYCGSAIEPRVIEDRPWARSCRRCENSIETVEMPSFSALAARRG